jgi:hypothetical protein
MAQMAIKNEVNIFTQLNTFKNDIILDSGGTTALTFDKAAVRQWRLSYSGTTNNLDIRRFVGGVLIDAPIEFIQATGRVQFAQGIDNAEGTATTPSYNFFNRNAGMYASAGDRLNWATAGVQRAFLDVSQFQLKVPLTAIDGVETAPGIAFASDLGTGAYATATAFNISANGQTIASFTSSSDIFAAEGRSWAGNSLRTAARPAFNFNSDSDTGFYNSAPNTIGIAIAGAGSYTLDAAAFWTGAGISIHGDGNNTPTNPAYAFNNDQDTGMYRSAANELSFATAGVQRLSISSVGRPIFFSPNAMELQTPAATTAASYQLKPGGILAFEMASGTTANPVWSLVRYSAGGGFLGLPIQVERLTGQILFPELPTTNPGGSGKLWKSSGFVAVT